MSLWFVEKNQRVIATGRVAERQAVGCSPEDRGSSPFPITAPWWRTRWIANPETQSDTLPGLFPPYSANGGKSRWMLAGLSA